MAKEVFMPKLGMTMETGTIMQWMVKEGEIVAAGDVLLEVMTNKINIEVEAYEDGTILKIYYGEGEDVPVNQVIAFIGQQGEIVPEHPPSSGDIQAEALLVEPSKVEEVVEEDMVIIEKPRATPAARKLARQNELNLTQIVGSGSRGRIHVNDVRTHISSSLRAFSEPTKVPVVPVLSMEDKSIKISGMRKVIGERMLRSTQEAPHVTLHSEADMSRAVQLRAELLPLIEKKTGLRLSYTEIILKAVAIALRDHPMVQATLENGVIKLHNQIHIGLAVSHPNGLLVPVIQEVDQLGLAKLTEKTKEVARDAREGKLSPDLLYGGTFTVSNLGMYAVDQFTPIINLPETAILGVGRIKEKPVGVKGEIVLRPMMALSLSFDHRTIDGAPAAAFLTQLIDTLENPSKLLV
jgi:pyruvate dehydrogenase E2 component (dihydrolipoamide acetyltransferase)